MAQPPHELVDPVVRAYREAQNSLRAEYARIVDDPMTWRRQAKILQLSSVIDARIDEANGTLRTWLDRELPNVYALGGESAAKTLGNQFAWTTHSTAAVESLAADTYEDFLGRTGFVRSRAKQALREVAGRYTRLSVTADKTAVKAASEAAREIGERYGIGAVRYADGSLHSVSEWAQVALRTKTATAYNEGTLRWSNDHGVKWFECFDGPNCGWSFHEDPDLALGKIVTDDEARKYPISHPNCRRAFGPRPDITDADQAKGAARSVTPEQTAAQRQADKERQAAQGRRARNRGTETRAQREQRTATRLKSLATARAKRAAQG